jgi:hypothetical protein
MLKFLLILFFLIFIVVRVSGMLLRMLGGGSQQGRNDQNRRYTSRNGNVNVDYQPKKKKPKGDFKGGEYVDYEELN